MPRKPKKPDRNSTRDIPWSAGSVRFRNGHWEARWTEGDKRPTQNFSTKEAAEDFLRARYRRKQRGGYVTPSDMTVADLLESYIERQIAFNEWASATINVNRRMADRHILPALGQLRVIEVDTLRLQKWVDTLAATYSPSTVQMCAALLSAAMKQAVKHHILTENPCSSVQRPKVEQKEMVTWSVEDIAKVDTFLRDEPKWLAVYRLMLSTGMRPGELYALTWSDIDFDRDMVRIRRTVTDSAEGKRIVGPTTKGGKTRYVALSPRPRAALLGWQETLVLRALKPDKDYVFPSRRGTPMGESVWLGMHAHIIQRCGVPKINLHGLRHSSATLELAVGTPIKVVSERLGHKDPLTTQRIYMHVDVTMQRSAAEAMDERLFGTK